MYKTLASYSSSLENKELSLVTILMGTFNGERFLKEQLNSIENQTYKNWILIVSDDGSNDATLKILQEYQSNWPEGKLFIRKGPRKGFCQNFLSLVCDPKLAEGYYAFCDQDDVWIANKLENAINKIQEQNIQDAPVMYCGRTKYVDEDLKECGISPLFRRPPSFKNALVQSIAGGNTMLLNYSAKLLLERAGSLSVVSHDWWAYQLITGAGGLVIYDPIPYVLYRQHEEALVGGNTTIFAKFKRIKMLFKGRFQSWNTININCLHSAMQILIKENVELLKLFEVLRNSNILGRISALNRCRLYRQTFAGSLSLYFAVLINKV